MNVNDELLAAYAEGNVSEEERIVVRQYLTENPDELEAVMLMMDEDYELELNESVDSVCCAENMVHFSDLVMSAAAFVPNITLKEMCQPAEKKSKHKKDRGTFMDRMNELLSDIY